MILLLCTFVCTGALAVLAATGFFAMRKIKSCEAQGMADASIQIAVAPIIRASFAAIAVFFVAAAIFLVQSF